MTDPVADLLTRIRNAASTKKASVLVPYSKLNEAIVNVLIKNSYLDASEVQEENGHKMLRLDLKYKNRSSVITTIQRVSKPGRRVYSSSEKLKKVLAGHGISIVSTSRGIMTNVEARQKSLGGEVLCKVY